MKNNNRPLRKQERRARSVDALFMRCKSAENVADGSAGSKLHAIHRPDPARALRALLMVGRLSYGLRKRYVAEFAAETVLVYSLIVATRLGLVYLSLTI